MQEDSNSYVKEIYWLNPNTSKLISAVENITLLANHSERTNKWDFSNAMDIEEEDTARTPKKQKDNLSIL